MVRVSFRIRCGNPGFKAAIAGVFCCVTFIKLFPTSTLPETNTFAPKNGWLEDEIFLLGRLGLFSVAFAVCFREGNM